MASVSKHRARILQDVAREHDSAPADAFRRPGEFALLRQAVSARAAQGNVFRAKEISSGFGIRKAWQAIEQDDRSSEAGDALCFDTRLPCPRAPVGQQAATFASRISIAATLRRGRVGDARDLR